MSLRHFNGRRVQRGVGLMEVMISIVIGMLLVLVIYQVYEISEGQKRTITAGSDAQQNASYAMYLMGRDVSMAGNGIASTAVQLDTCAMLRPIPVVIEQGASANDPDKITVLYGGSPSLSTAVPFRASATGAADYLVPGPVGFSANTGEPSKSDLIAAVQGANCTISTITAVAIDPATGNSRISHAPVAGPTAATYGSGVATLDNLGPAASMGRIEYTVDPAGSVLRSQNLLPDPATAAAPSPIVNDVVNVKAQYGVDRDCNGVLVWTDPTGTWSAANVATLPLPTAAPVCTAGAASSRKIQAIRIAIVTRSTQWDKDVVTPKLPADAAMDAGKIGLFCDPAPPDCAVKMNLTEDDQHYRYKVLETAIPLRNALWNGQ
jgi:type IV pilus assembly protein PilW